MPDSTRQTSAGITAVHWLIVIALPLALVLLNARLLMGRAFLRWEYNRPGFPPDPYGFTAQDRLTYAPLALDYLFNDAGIDFLAEQSLPDGSSLYNQRELSHMQDVKAVARQLTLAGLAALVLVVAGVTFLAWRPETRPALRLALLRGGLLTAGLVILGVTSVAIGFRTFFTQFHALFFEGETWIFPTSDTLIRLFPEEFWIDAFGLLFGGALIEALILAGAMWWWVAARQGA
jgi:integral membrane protein (TIGR01906 family)